MKLRNSAEQKISQAPRVARTVTRRSPARAQSTPRHRLSTRHKSLTDANFSYEQADAILQACAVVAPKALKGGQHVNSTRPGTGLSELRREFRVWFMIALVVMFASAAEDSPMDSFVKAVSGSS